MSRTQVAIYNPRLFFYVVTAILLSAYDAVATMQHIGRGVAAEGNPLMDSLIQVNAVVFFAVKMAMTSMCLMFCYRFSHLRTARLGIHVAVVVYSLVTVYHAVIAFLD